MSHARTAADQAVLERLEQLENSVTRQTAAVGELRGLILNNVLLDELVTIPAGGVLERSISAPGAYLAAWAYGSAVVIAPEGAGAAAPPSGIGVKRLPGGLAMGWAFTGSVVSIYGTPGDQVLLAIWSVPMAPFVAAAGDVIGGTP